jgi:hypothetical protein
MDKEIIMEEEADELEYLRWFVGHCDFGPGDGDERERLNDAFMKEANKLIPKGWRIE